MGSLQQFPPQFQGERNGMSEMNVPTRSLSKHFEPNVVNIKKYLKGQVRTDGVKTDEDT